MQQLTAIPVARPDFAAPYCDPCHQARLCSSLLRSLSPSQTLQQLTKIPVTKPGIAAACCDPCHQARLCSSFPNPDDVNQSIGIGRSGLRAALPSEASPSPIRLIWAKSSGLERPPPDVAEVRGSRTYPWQDLKLTVAILAQGTSWAVAATQAFLGVGSSPDKCKN